MLSRESYRVGWICLLEVEQIAAMEMLDDEHPPLPQPSADTNVYNLGSINNHNVVIAGLPRAGNYSAATVVTQMRTTFPNLKYGLLVGIGGGVPIKTDHGMIRLGHVVNMEALQLSRLRTFRRFKFPSTANDYLYPSHYTHKQDGVSCADGGCDPKQRIERPNDEEGEPFIIVHRGTIASGELVIKDAKQRDDLAQEHGVLCFEMEAAGALADLPCMVIRGISDYCDSHKNDQWHGYAAAVAAAYARQLFFHMAIEEVQRTPNPTPTAFELPLNLSEISEVTHFVAREDQLKKIQEILGATVGRCTAVVHGLGGIGKTQLAIAYIKRHRSDYSAEIWPNARDETSLKQSFARAAKWILRHHPSITYIAGALESRDLDKTVKAVNRWLNDASNNRWLLVYDNYDNLLMGTHTGKISTYTSSPGAATYSGDDRDLAKAFDLQSFLPEADHGAIVVTTRSSMVKIGRTIHLRKLEDINDSLEVLTSVSGRKDLKQDPVAADLARQLDGLPLALATAGAYLEQTSISCTEYLQLYRESWQQLHKETPQLPAYDQTLHSTWNLSYGYIQQHSPTAAMLLRQWAYFSSEDLCHGLVEADQPAMSKHVESRGREESEFWLIQRRLTAHADRCLKTIRMMEIEDKALGTLLPLGWLYKDQRRLQDAEAVYERALEGYEKISPANSITTRIPALGAVVNLGCLCEKQGNVFDALLYSQRALDSTDIIYGRQSQTYAMLSSQISSLQRARSEKIDKQDFIFQK
ncbi:Disease resistance protein [Penicillium atrosanguineum]|uniref:Disease resistance protein n=1 Tax=Penicillium atrosanguineum TaxID=1132637 RepID=A0A9W9KU26_9EURO|nr:Disease resistance protein [Penicillium atrosanguineum]KAJ5119435.1 Disease resistance protein [Penicillium atrosanguineum]KAJ5299200.1 Disease resistance protein [Penicillium atrosanguineum]